MVALPVAAGILLLSAIVPAAAAAVVDWQRRVSNHKRRTEWNALPIGRASRTSSKCLKNSQH